MGVRREPEGGVPSAPLLKPSRHRRSETPVADDEVNDVLTAVNGGDESTASQLLTRIATGTNPLSSSVEELLADLADSLTASDDLRGLAWLAVGHSRELRLDLPGASDAYERAYEMAPTGGFLVRRVRLCRRLQGASAAAELLSNTTDIGPGGAAVLAEAASLAIELRLHSVADSLISSVEKLEPGGSNALLLRARLLIVTGRPEEAIQVAREVVPSQPSLGRVVLAVAMHHVGLDATDPGLLDAILVNRPEEPWALLELAHVLTELGRTAVAEDVLTQLMLSSPADRYPALRSRAMVRAMDGRYSDASADLERASEVSQDPWLTQMRGELARLQGDLATAVQHFKSLPESERPAWVAASLGWALLGLRDIPGANEAFSQALKVDEHNIDALRGCAEIELQMGTPESFDRAEDVLRRAAAVDGNDPRIIALLAEAWRRRGRFRDAVDGFTRALDLQPNFSWALASRGQAWIGLEKLDDAIQDLTQAATQAPSEAWIVNELIAVLEQLQPESADIELARLMRMAEESKADLRPLCVGRAELAARQKRWVDAERLYGQARRLFGNDSEFVEGQVDALRQLGRHEDALEEIERLPGPLSEDFRWTRIDLLWATGQLAAARQDLERMSMEEEPPPSAVAALGESYRLEGRLAQARELLESAYRQQPDDAWTLGSLGALEMDDDHPQQARLYLRRALEFEPDYGFALRILAALELSEGNDKVVRDLVERTAKSSDPMVVAMRANSLYGMGEYADAWQVLDDYLTGAPHDLDLLRARGWVELALGQSGEAVRSFTLAAPLNISSQSLVRAVESLLRVELWHKAAEIVQDSEDRDNPASGSARAALLLGAGLWDQAPTFAQRGSERLGGSLDAVAISSETLRRAGKVLDALKLAEQLSAAAPANVDYLVNRAECLLLSERGPEAMMAFRQALVRLDRRSHLDADEQHQRGLCLLRMGRFSEAADTFLRTLTVTDDVAAVLLNLVLASLLQGESRQAKVLINRLNDELTTLSPASLRGDIATALQDISTMRDQLPSHVLSQANELEEHLQGVLAQLPHSFDELVMERPDGPSSVIYSGRQSTY